MDGARFSAAMNAVRGATTARPRRRPACLVHPGQQAHQTLRRPLFWPQQRRANSAFPELVISKVEVGGYDRHLAQMREELKKDPRLNTPVDDGGSRGRGMRPRRGLGRFNRPDSSSLSYRGRQTVQRTEPEMTPLPTMAAQLASRRQTSKYGMFSALLNAQISTMLHHMGPWTPDHREYRAFGLRSQNAVDRQGRLFRASVRKCLWLAEMRNAVSREDNPLFWVLRDAFVRGDTSALMTALRYEFQCSLLRFQTPGTIRQLQRAVANLRNPYEWYPATRTMQRTIHLHVGPTNSGKTYHALQALENARTGIYAGPLRLLAHEVYSRFTAKGKRCALITGEEQRFPSDDGGSSSSGSPGGAENACYFQSCTVEMTPLNQRVDVAVIDEIQMMADEDRGWAWTQALLGVQAREVHLCGEERAVDLVRFMAARMGDTCIVHKYKRLSGLQTMREGLHGDFGKLRKGDAVVSFSRINLHTLKAGIEKMTGRRCAIVYGSLPPETRAQQAALFNDPNNDYDFLVASDAIGMGLNLEIKRVIFETASKHDGISFRHLTVPEIKQIGGRAGRFRSAAQAIKMSTADAGAVAETDADAVASAVADAETPTEAEASHPGPDSQQAPQDASGTIGLVATLEDEDLPVIQKAFEQEAAPLQWAGIQPPTFALERMAGYFPADAPFSFILQRLREMSQLSSGFRLCTPKESLAVADIIQPYALSVADRCIFISAPCSLRDPGFKEVLQAMARCVADMRGGHLLDIGAIRLEILDATSNDYPEGPEKYLMHLETLHKAITLYLWLSYRYVGVFSSQQLAFHVKALVEEKITAYLENLTFVPERRQKRANTIRKLARRHEQHERSGQRLLDADDAVAEVDTTADLAAAETAASMRSQATRPDSVSA